MPDLLASSRDRDLEVGLNHNKIIEIVEEALKWRFQAQERKLNEQVMQLEEREGKMRRDFKDLNQECHGEFMEIRNQIVEVTSEVLVQV